MADAVRARLWITQNPRISADETRLHARLRVEPATPQAELVLQVRLRLADELESVRRGGTARNLRSEATVTAGSIELPLGSDWSADREYELVFVVDSTDRPRHQDLQAAVVKLVAGDEPPRAVTVARAIRVHFLGEEAGSWSSRAVAEPDPSLQSLADEVRAGCEAYLEGSTADARAHWKRAEALARSLGAKDSSWRLGELTSAERVEPRDLIELGQAFLPAGTQEEVTARCPDCGRIALAEDRFCEQCGARLQPAVRR
jgi:hypothetical protein